MTEHTTGGFDGRMRSWFERHEKLSVAILAVIFLLIRLPGTSQPLHQDEYKWPIIVNPSNASSAVQIPHPPLSEFIYRAAGEVVGFNVHFRFVPLLFSVANLVLLYVLLRKRFGKKVALIGSMLFTLSYFSILASLMVDTDGAIMPFFFLLMFIAYDQIRLPQEVTKSIQSTSNTPNSAKKPRFLFWTIVGIVAALGGLFIKVSFVLGVVALAADFLWDQWTKSRLKKADVLRYGGYALGFVVGFVLLLIISQKIFPFFSLSQSVVYWEHFVSFHHDWFQTLIQVAKAVLYSSPFLILVPFFLQWKKSDLANRLRPFLFFLLFGFIFYIILFDFSLGALDRYLQFIIIPLCAIAAVVVVQHLPTNAVSINRRRSVQAGVFAVGISIVLVLLAFLPHAVPSLHPKAAWIGRITSLHWAFLYPFSGGSGPMGFYVSFLFIGLAWILSLGLLVFGLAKKNFRPYALLVLIIVGLAYNLMFTEEYLFGRINGSAPLLLTHVVTFIKNDPAIQHVTVYNDNGGQEIQAIGKYRKRLYTDPKFDITQKISTLNQYKEHYLEINIPRIDPTSVYRAYLDSCVVIYRETDHAISATVYDCQNAPDVKE